MWSTLQMQRYQFLIMVIGLRVGHDGVCELWGGTILDKCFKDVHVYTIHFNLCNTKHKDAFVSLLALLVIHDAHNDQCSQSHRQ